MDWNDTRLPGEIPRELLDAAIAVVIPCYRVKGRILKVLAGIGPEVSRIYVVDDLCPEQSGRWVQASCGDQRVTVLFHEKNKGVGGAVMTGYRRALVDGADVVLKLDGDGQMDPRLIPTFAAPILGRRADYVKGNRFYQLESLGRMPRLRLIGNSLVSFVCKAASGYWDIMDPTNGYTAIHADVLRRLPLHKISEGYFFESDMLFRLSTIRAVVQDVPMDAVYAGEGSSLRLGREAVRFASRYCSRLLKRIFYTYYLRDFNVCSIEIAAGFPMLFGGAAFGAWHWYHGALSGHLTSAGTVMLAAVPVIMGFQLLLAAVSFDVGNVPRRPLCSTVLGAGRRRAGEETEEQRAGAGEGADGA